MAGFAQMGEAEKAGLLRRQIHLGAAEAVFEKRVGPGKIERGPEEVFRLAHQAENAVVPGQFHPKPGRHLQVGHGSKAKARDLHFGAQIQQKALVVPCRSAGNKPRAQVIVAQKGRPDRGPPG